MAIAKTKILFATELPMLSGSFLYRVMAPFHALKQAGHEARICLGQLQSTLRTFSPESIVIARSITPNDLLAVREYSNSTGCELIYDIDDLVFDPEILDQSELFESARQERMPETIEMILRHQDTLKTASRVLVSTPSLKMEALRFNANVVVQRNFFPDNHFKYFDCAPEDATSPPSIVYAGSSGFHGRFLEVALESLFLAMERHPSLVLKVCGGNLLPDEFRKFGKRIAYPAMMPPSKYFEFIAGSSVMIAPMFIDRFTICKSWIKCLEPEVAGIPWIASPHPEYVEFKEMSATDRGYIAQSGADWLEAIAEAISLPHRRRPREEFLASANSTVANYLA